jgi:predicted metal-dependent peptidase
MQPSVVHWTKVIPTPAQQKSVDVSMIAFMNAAPFYAQVFYSLGKLVITRDVPTAATDGRHIIINPDYFCQLKVSERVFILLHEMWHYVSLHAQRFAHYASQNTVRGLPWDHEFANRCADYIINADILRTTPGATINPDWLWDPGVTGDELWEDLYVARYVPPPLSQNTPPPPPGGGGGGAGGPTPGKTPSRQGRALKGAQGDPVAASKGGSFDIVLPPSADLPDAHEFKEVMARAASVARAMGKMPGSAQRLVDALLTHQVEWREHIRMLITGKIGARGENWTRPNRRRLALNPIVIMPGKHGYSAELVVVAVDTSGSIDTPELTTFLSEVGGILDDCRPRTILVLGCDAHITQETVVTSLSEVHELAHTGIKGGGGTDFRPVFDLLAERELMPDALVYLTDGCGGFPAAPPAYPVIWAMTTDVSPPFGETVKIKVLEAA